MAPMTEQLYSLAAVTPLEPRPMLCSPQSWNQCALIQTPAASCRKQEVRGVQQTKQDRDPLPPEVLDLDLSLQA